MKYVAFLRGIMPQMVASHRMENLRSIFEDMGFSDVKSFIASGNIIFTSSEKSRKKLEAKIENALMDKSGIATVAILRSKEELEDMINENPFRSVKVSDKAKPNVTFFKSPPNKNDLPQEGKGYKGYGMTGGAYCYTVDMVSVKTPEVMITLEKQFEKEITTRTWNTVTRVTKLL